MLGQTIHIERGRTSGVNASESGSDANFGKTLKAWLRTSWNVCTTRLQQFVHEDIIIRATIHQVQYYPASIMYRKGWECQIQTSSPDASQQLERAVRGKYRVVLEDREWNGIGLIIVGYAIEVFSSGATTWSIHIEPKPAPIGIFADSLPYLVKDDEPQS